MRIAGVQIGYLPAYFDEQKDWLCHPVEDLYDLARLDSGPWMARWRDRLRDEYCISFQRKLERLVTYCASLHVDLIVFPEYSVPSEALLLMRSLSKVHGVSILAGSHRVNSHHPSFLLGLPELRDAESHGRAIAPLFTDGHATILTKVHGSRYDQEISVPPKVANNPRFVTVAGRRLRVRICSDYLHDAPTARTQADLDVVISYTPALGEFAARATSDSWSASLARASRTQKRVSNRVVLFVNEMGRGGTKCFFSNRHAFRLAMEEDDGTYGQCETKANRVVACGLPAGVEAILVVDVDGPRSLRVRQHALVPILHCAGPDDAGVRTVCDFLDGYRQVHGVYEKLSFLRTNLPALSSETRLLRHRILDAKLNHLQAHLGSIHEEGLLDRLANTICVIHEEAPSLQSWTYRASIATTLRLREESPTNRSAAVFDQLVRDCEGAAVGALAARDVCLIEQRTMPLLRQLTSDQMLQLSGPVRVGVVGRPSRTSAITFGVQLIRHLIQAGDIAGGLRVVGQMIELRPSIPLDICEELQGDLTATDRKVGDIVRRCDEFLERRETAVRQMDGVFRSVVAEPIHGAVVYGYSDVVLNLLRSMGHPLPLVIFPQCRNASVDVWYMRELESIGARVTYVPYATLSHLIQNGVPRLDAVYMGFSAGGPDGVLNTVGSLGLAVIAKHFGIRVTFVGQSFKVVSGERWETARRSAAEAEIDPEWPQEPALDLGLLPRVANPHSDLVPWGLVDTVIMESGVVTAAELSSRLSDMGGAIQ